MRGRSGGSPSRMNQQMSCFFCACRAPVIVGVLLGSFFFPLVIHGLARLARTTISPDLQFYLVAAEAEGPTGAPSCALSLYVCTGYPCIGL